MLPEFQEIQIVILDLKSMAFGRIALSGKPHLIVAIGAIRLSTQRFPLKLLIFVQAILTSSLETLDQSVRQPVMDRIGPILTAAVGLLTAAAATLATILIG